MQSLGRPTLCYRASALEILPIAFIVTISEHKSWHPRFYLSCSSVTPALTPPKVISPLYWSKPLKTVTALVAAAPADQGPSLKLHYRKKRFGIWCCIRAYSKIAVTSIETPVEGWCKFQ